MKHLTYSKGTNFSIKEQGYKQKEIAKGMDFTYVTQNKQAMFNTS